MRSPRSLRLTDIERGSANSAYVSRAHNAARVIVRKDECGGIGKESPAEHFAGMDDDHVKGAAGDLVIGDEIVARREVEHAEAF